MRVATNGNRGGPSPACWTESTEVNGAEGRVIVAALAPALGAGPCRVRACTSPVSDIAGCHREPLPFDPDKQLVEVPEVAVSGNQEPPRAWCDASSLGYVLPDERRSFREEPLVVQSDADEGRTNGCDVEGSAVQFGAVLCLGSDKWRKGECASGE